LFNFLDFNWTWIEFLPLFTKVGQNPRNPVGLDKILSILFDKILSILLENDDPEDLIKSTIKRKLQQLNLNPVHTVKKCPVYCCGQWPNYMDKYVQTGTSVL